MKIVYKAHSRSRSIRIRLSGAGSLVITYPKTFSKERVKQYFKANQSRILSECTNHVGTSYEKLLGTTFTVLPDDAKISFESGTERRIVHQKKLLRIQTTGKEDFLDPDFTDEIKKSVKAFLRKRRYFLQELTDLYASRYGYSYSRLFYKNQKSRWGSCSSANNINLNIRLLLLPKNLVEYVIVHELVHTVEKSHNSTFWAILTGLMEDCRERRRELRMHTFSFLD